MFAEEFLSRKGRKERIVLKLRELCELCVRLTGDYATRFV